MFVFAFGIAWLTICLPMAAALWAPEKAAGISTLGSLAFALVFLFAGVAMVLAPLSVYFTEQRSAYAFTDQRMVKVTRKLARVKVRSVWIRDIVALERSERSDGSGTLKLGLGTRRDAEGALVEDADFLREIKNVRDVEAIIRAQKDFPPTLR